MIGHEQNDAAETSLSADGNAAKVEAHRNNLLHSISSGLLDTIQERVAWVLNHFPDARDSDITLQIKFWETFYPGIATSESIRKADLYELPRLGSLARARAKIQNTYNLFKASAEIQRIRGTLSEGEQAKARGQRPVKGRLAVYMDESGKTDDVLIVGSVWFLHLPQFLSFVEEFHEFKSDNGFESHEIHFKKIKNHNAPVYIRFANWLASKSSVISFKSVSVPRAGLPNTNLALEKLFYHLLVRGVEHENATGRAPLPRGLEVWKDQEEAGSDSLLLAEIEHKLQADSASRFNSELQLGRFEAVDSKDNALLQIADLYTSSLNRVLNRKENFDGPKDEVARHFLALLGIPDGPRTLESDGDISMHVSL